MFIGAFSLLNVLGDLYYAGFDANLWWIDLRPLGPWLSQGVLTTSSLLLIAWAVKPWCSVWRHSVTIMAIATLLGTVAANALVFHVLAARGAIAAGCPVSFSLLIAAALAIVIAGVWAKPGPVRGRLKTVELGVAGLSIVAGLVGFPLAQMCCFGMTDYRRPADAVVVFGARVYADGRPSLAVADRVRTACTLYRQGLAGTVIVSGGPGDGAIHETQAMRQLAIQLGVPADDILTDDRGLNTEATVRNSGKLFDRHGIGTVLVVSHFYHLPRIKLSYQRHGWEVYTVPADQTRVLARLPQYMLREVAALWVYYLRPLCPTYSKSKDIAVSRPATVLEVANQHHASACAKGPSTYSNRPSLRQITCSSSPALPVSSLSCFSGAFSSALFSCLSTLPYRLSPVPLLGETK